MDIPEVEVVINYEVPTHVKTYVHRVGRTARAGRSGVSYTLLQNEEVYHFKEMLKKAEKNIPSSSATTSGDNPSSNPQAPKKFKFDYESIKPLMPVYKVHYLSFYSPFASFSSLCLSFCSDLCVLYYLGITCETEGTLARGTKNRSHKRRVFLLFLFLFFLLLFKETNQQQGQTKTKEVRIEYISTSLKKSFASPNTPTTRVCSFVCGRHRNNGCWSSGLPLGTHLCFLPCHFIRIVL
jgi:hypothetical protein